MMDEAVITIGVGETRSFSHGDSIESPTDGLVITAVDHEAGTITLGNMLKRLYSSERVEELMHRESPLFGMIRTGTPTRLAGCKIGEAPIGAIGGATVAVITTVAALEWLRQRKAQVAAAEGSDEAYRSLLSDFIVWLTALFARMKAAG